MIEYNKLGRNTFYLSLIPTLFYKMLFIFLEIEMNKHHDIHTDFGPGFAAYLLLFPYAFSCLTNLISGFVWILLEYEYSNNKLILLPIIMTSLSYIPFLILLVVTVLKIFAK